MVKKPEKKQRLTSPFISDEYIKGFNEGYDVVMTYHNAVIARDYVRKDALPTVRDIKSKLDYYNLPENGFHTRVMAKAIHQLITEKGKDDD